jgi:ankyrin repeat protein
MSKPVGAPRLDSIRTQFVARGADVNARFERAGYSTALHGAATMGQEQAVSWLLEHGADTTVHSCWGAIPENSACFGGHSELAERIQRHRLRR